VTYIRRHWAHVFKLVSAVALALATVACRNSLSVSRRAISLRSPHTDTNSSLIDYPASSGSLDAQPLQATLDKTETPRPNWWSRLARQSPYSPLVERGVGGRGPFPFSSTCYRSTVLTMSPMYVGVWASWYTGRLRVLPSTGDDEIVIGRTTNRSSGLRKRPKRRTVAQLKGIWDVYWVLYCLPGSDMSHKNAPFVFDWLIFI